MSVAQPNLPGAGVTIRILRDDGAVQAGVTLPAETFTPGRAAAQLAAATGLSAAEQARARNFTTPDTVIPRQPDSEGLGWAIYTLAGQRVAYVLRDDGTHLSWGATQAVFTPSRATAALSGVSGLSAAELARLAGLGGTSSIVNTLPALSARPTVDVFGESYGWYMVSPGIHWACWSGSYHPDISYNYRQYFTANATGNGVTTPQTDPGNNYAVGQTNTTHFRDVQVPAAIARGVSEIGWTAAGYNDNPANSTQAQAVANRIIQGVTALLNAGQKRHAIFEPMLPDVYANVINPLLQAYAASDPRVSFIFQRDLLFSNTATMIWNGRTNAFGVAQSIFGSYSDDGVHHSGRAVRALAPRISAQMQAWGIAQIGFVPTVIPAVDFNSSTNPNGPVLGRAGMIQGTNGIYNQATQPGTVAGFYSSGSSLFVTGQPAGMLTAAAISTYNGYNEQRWTVGDVTGQNAMLVDFVPVTASNVNNGDASARFRFVCIYRAISLSNLSSINVSFFNASYNIAQTNQAMWGDTAGATFDDNTSFELTVYSLGPVPLSGNITAATAAVTAITQFGDKAVTGHINAGQGGVSRADLRKIV